MFVQSLRPIIILISRVKLIRNGAGANITDDRLPQSDRRNTRLRTAITTSMQLISNITTYIKSRNILFISLSLFLNITQNMNT